MDEIRKVTKKIGIWVAFFSGDDAVLNVRTFLFSDCDVNNICVLKMADVIYYTNRSFNAFSL